MQRRSSVKKFLGMLSGSAKDKENVKARERSQRHHDIIFGNADAVYCENRTEILANLPGHELDLIHFITGHGILRKEMR